LRFFSSICKSSLKFTRKLEMLTPTEQYIFDTNGYIVLRKVFELEDIEKVNRLIDNHELHERKGALRCSTLYGRDSNHLAGDGVTGRFDMGGMLGWPSPECEFFREVLTTPKLTPILSQLLGLGYRLDHSPLLIAMVKGSEGHTLHGGAIGENGEPAWNIGYQCRQGVIRSELLTVCVQLSDTQRGDGGFCILPGSHKSNFPVPASIADFSDHNELIVQPTPCRGGS